MATGRGRRLGEALKNALRAAGWHRGREVKGWHARLSALTRTARGQQELLRAGLEPGKRARNWRRWLAQEREMSKANQQKVARAYAAYRKPEAVRTMTARITGEITTEGNTPRRRGIDEAPLLIDHRATDSPGSHQARWRRVEQAFDDDVPDQVFEDIYYIDVIVPDLGDFSVFELGAGGYVVTLT